MAPELDGYLVVTTTQDVSYIPPLLFPVLSLRG
jgi:hypothetical protein